jgi:hypothetical protein
LIELIDGDSLWLERLAHRCSIALTLRCPPTAEHLRGLRKKDIR